MFGPSVVTTRPELVKFSEVWLLDLVNQSLTDRSIRHELRNIKTLNETFIERYIRYTHTERHRQRQRQCQQQGPLKCIVTLQNGAILEHHRWLALDADARYGNTFSHCVHTHICFVKSTKLDCEQNLSPYQNPGSTFAIEYSKMFWNDGNIVYPKTLQKIVLLN